jgi:hypothetical protein
MAVREDVGMGAGRHGGAEQAAGGRRQQASDGGNRPHAGEWGWQNEAK